jgi:hypothetical protein
MSFIDLIKSNTTTEARMTIEDWERLVAAPCCPSQR